MKHLKNQIITDASMPDAANVIDGEMVVRTEPGHPEILLKMNDGSFATFIDSGVVSTALENITTGSVDLSNYYNKDETDAYLATKVDKEAGKILSSNDYTTEEKNKLAGLSNYDDQEIRNELANKIDSASLSTVATTGSYNDLFDKPTIPTKTSELTNDSGFLTEHQDISGKADKTDVYTKDESDTLLSQKVDKEDGKGLSSNDYTTDEKEKLASLSNYDDAEIRDILSGKANESELSTVAKSGSYNDLSDKPVIPTQTSELTNDSGFLTEHQDISGKADKADTLAGYGITDAYTKTETDSILESYRKKTTVDFITNTGETTVLLSAEYLPVISGYTGLTITLPDGSDTDGVEYNIQFTAPDEGMTLNVPDALKWNGGLEPAINSGMTYQISILNNLAVIGEF